MAFFNSPRCFAYTSRKGRGAVAGQGTRRGAGCERKGLEPAGVEVADQVLPFAGEFADPETRRSPERSRGGKAPAPVVERPSLGCKLPVVCQIEEAGKLPFVVKPTKGIVSGMPIELSR